MKFSATLARSIAALAIALLPGCQGEPGHVDGLSIRGLVFADQNGNGTLDSREAGIPDITVFLDLDANELLGDGEPAVQTGPKGGYAFTGLQPGSYLVRQQLPFGLRNEADANAREFSRPKYNSQSPIGTEHSSIIGGADVDANFYPFMASIGSYDGATYSQFCGGALVSDQFVLTAAHCSEDTNPAEVAVMLGSQLASEGGTLLRVSSILIHPDWSGSITEGHDMALWKLRERVNLEQLGLSTVDMLTPDHALLARSGALATTIGWGVSNSPSPALQEVHVPLVSSDQCAAAYPEVPNFATQICAGASAGGLDTCQGDSGGPLLVRDAAGERWLHAGITSWGDGCALPGKPGIYGRTSALSNWARAQMMNSSLAYKLKLSGANAIVDFADQPTIRPLLAPVPDRWSLSTVDAISQSLDSLLANAEVTLRFFLFADPEAGKAPGASAIFQCSFDPDGEGPEASKDFACDAGLNQLRFGGYRDGLYMSRVEVRSASRTGQRSFLAQAGTPSVTETSGELSLNDAYDPDYAPDSYFIDYFEIQNLVPGIVSRIDVDAGFEVALALYDGDTRDSAAGGGRISQDFGQPPNTTKASLTLVPEAGRSYLIGVSTLGQQIRGPYTLRVLNSGSAVATPL